MTTPPFTGYPGQIWATCWQSMAWLNQILANGTADISKIDSPVAAVAATLRNALNSLAAWQTGVTLSLEAQNLAIVQAMPLGLDVTTAAYFTARVNAVAAAAVDISALPTPASPFSAIALLTTGKPAIADPMFLEWCMTFTGESVPAGLTASNLPADAVAAAAAWLSVAMAVGVLQGTNLTTAYDAAARMYRCSAVIAANIEQLQSGPFGDLPLSSLWNGAVSLPTILLDSSSQASSPASLVAQQVSIIRYALNVQLASLSLLLLSLRSHSVTQPATSFMLNSESLMDFANRVNGNFETWREVAVLNSVQPPFPGPTNTALAMSGRPLFTSGDGITPDPDSQRPTYAANVLGTDYDFGPINGVQPPWLGDIAVITGLLNFSRSIGRRIQTPLGTLIYHPNYGCRIPPEVGAIQSLDEASRLAAYGRSAIAADPRTGNIQSAIATVQPGFLATFSAVLTPIGPAQTSVQVNETIGAPA